ncbi:MAG: FecR domain-containing protein [Tannerella sp.]|jgi:ferric-dicitrate binding protein FerR (iron transport regulator)|nr:FecR domain-containing protein [Tannerella sp.]
MKTENIRINPRWRKSREEIWTGTFEHLDGREHRKPFPKRIPYWSYAAALLLFAFLTAYLYTVSEEAARGTHLTVRLPDGSRATLNAGSRLSYKPCAWLVSRKVSLEGEACFEVTPGSRFSVRSGRNVTEALGTTFNVYARPEMYRVACLTGRVEVRADGETFVLHPDMQLTCRGGRQTVAGQIAPAQAAGWMQRKFVFIETPLAEVVAEMERQYDMRVTCSGPDLKRLFYTGNFIMTAHPEDVLDIIGRPFGITFSIEK